MPNQARPSVLRVWRCVFASSGRPVLLRSLSVAFGVGIPGAIVFSPLGLSAHDAVRILHASLPARAFVWAVWLALAAPATRAVFTSPGSQTLRALISENFALIGALLLLACVGELPWFALFAAGASPLAGASALLLAVSIECAAICAASRTSIRALGVAACAVVAWDPNALVAFSIGSVLAPLCVRAAWATAHEAGAPRFRVLRRAPPWLALYLTHLLKLTRSARARLAAGAFGTSAGAALLALSAEHDPSARPLQRALSVMTLPSAIASALCVAPLLASESDLRGLLSTLRIKKSVVLSTFCLALATPTSAFAASAGAVASGAVHVTPFALAGTLALWGSALGSAIAVFGRYHARSARRNSALFVVGVAALAALAIWAVNAC